MIAGIIDDIRRVFQGLAEKSRRIEHATGLTPSQTWAIKMLEAAPMKVSDLAKRMYLHPATVVGILDRLEAKDMVQRTRSDKDRRVVNICLTDRGRKLLQNSPEVAQGHFLHELEALSTQELETIHGGMEKIVKILGYEEIPPQLIMSSEINASMRRRKKPR